MLETIVVDPKIRVRDANELLFTPRIIRIRSFEEENVKHFSEEVSAACQTGQNILPLVIDSYGGDCYALLAMVDILRTVKVPIATIAEGKVMSCGAAMFACGTEGYRFIGPNATIMLHEVSESPRPEALKATDMKIDAQETNRLNKKLWRLMERAINRPCGSLWDEFNKRSRSEWYITPKEALRLNLANKIGIPTLRTTISVETTLSL